MQPELVEDPLVTKRATVLIQRFARWLGVHVRHTWACAHYGRTYWSIWERHRLGTLSPGELDSFEAAILADMIDGFAVVDMWD